MKTYKDILVWADNQILLPIEHGRMTDNFEYIFDLPLPSTTEIEYPLLERVVLGDYSILYFRNEPFSIYFSGEEYDYAHWVLNEVVWKRTRQYVFQSLCTLTPSFPQATPLEAYIEPIDGKFIWEALPKEERPTLFKASRNYAVHDEENDWLDEFKLVGFGYTEELAIQDLVEQTVGFNGEFLGKLVVEEVKHEH